MKWMLVFVYLYSPGVTVEVRSEMESPAHCAANASHWVDEAQKVGGEVVQFDCYQLPATYSAAEEH